jgi:DNA polymerase III subunit epsilon
MPSSEKLDEFPLHPSSLDGHRHTCITCIADQRKRQQVSRAEYKQQQERETLQRAKNNTILRAYGYRWKKEEIWDDFCEDTREAWVLYTPSGKQISTSDALQEIVEMQTHKPGHPSALWAKDILSRPKVLVLDTETTGFDENAEVIDIAVIDGSGRVRMNTLIQCQTTTIPPQAKAVHHINELMLRNAPTFPQVWEKLKNAFPSYEIVIYNADYDVRILKQTAKRYGIELPEMNAHCLMKQYSSYVNRSSSHSEGYSYLKLAAACLHFQIEQPEAHRALADAQSSLRVMRKMAEQANRSNQ